MQIFKPGDIVRIKGTGDSGSIMEGPRANDQGINEYRVFFAATRRPWLPENDLCRPLLSREPLELAREGIYCGLNDFRTYLTLKKLSHPMTNVIYAFLSSRTDFLPHQFIPLLKLLEVPGGRLLIADEVGLGKTIEAGIILAELKTRKDMKRVLVVCQGGLLHDKWKKEMIERFDEEFIIATRADLNEFFQAFRDGKDPVFYAICSLPLLRQDYFQQCLRDYQVPFDLVIIDEAHRLRNADTASYQLGEVLAENADFLIFLTATPLHLGSRDLFNLLSLLDPAEFQRFEYFEDLVEPNQYINRALSLLRRGPFDADSCLVELEKVLNTTQAGRFRSNPFFVDSQNALKSHSDWKSEALVTLEQKISRLNSLAHIFTRTKRRNVDVNFPQRTPVTVTVHLSPEEKEFSRSLESSADRLMARSKSILGVFATMMLRRQLASCIPATISYLAEKVDNVHNSLDMKDELEIDDLEFEDIGNESLSLGLSSDFMHDAQALLEKGPKLREVDSKFKEFLCYLKEQLKQGEIKFIVFSFFKRTLKYLSKRLQEEGIPAFLLTGDLEESERLKVVEEFRDSNEPFVLLSSEVGGEGLDFQFCHIMFNYDLPWNPMVVEQRIGRIDRYGQKSPRVIIFNFKVPGTVEDRIFIDYMNELIFSKKRLATLKQFLVLN